VQYEVKQPIENIDNIDNIKLVEQVDYILQHNIENYLKNFK